MFYVSDKNSQYLHYFDTVGVRTNPLVKTTILNLL